MTRRDTLLRKIVKRVTIDHDTGCWLWQGPTSGKSGRGKGYPRMDVNGGTMAVHRVMWIIENGPLPPRKQLDHACRNRLCVRPAEDHNRMVTHKQNQRLRDQAKITCEGIPERPAVRAKMYSEE